GLEVPDHPADEVPVLNVADERFDRAAGDFFPCGNPHRKRLDRRQAIGAALQVHQAPRKIIDHCNGMIAPAEIHGASPAQVTIATQDQNPHQVTLLRSLNRGGTPSPPHLPGSADYTLRLPPREGLFAPRRRTIPHLTLYLIVRYNSRPSVRGTPEFLARPSNPIIWINLFKDFRQ